MWINIQLNPHSGVRGILRAPSPAGSFLGGFRTPATGVCRAAGAGRHPKPSTNPEILATSTCFPLFTKPTDMQRPRRHFRVGPNAEVALFIYQRVAAGISNLVPTRR